MIVPITFLHIIIAWFRILYQTTKENDMLQSVADDYQKYYKYIVDEKQKMYEMGISNKSNKISD